MNKNNKDNKQTLALAGIFIIALGALCVVASKISEQEFKDLSSKLNTAFGSVLNKKTEDMNVSELETLLKKLILEENYEKCTDIKKLIDYKKQQLKKGDS